MKNFTRYAAAVLVIAFFAGMFASCATGTNAYQRNYHLCPAYGQADQAPTAVKPC